MRFLAIICFVLATIAVCAVAQTAPAQTPARTASNATSDHKEQSSSRPQIGSTIPAKGKVRPFMGRVLRESSGYVLKAGDLEYKLDKIDVIRNYNGKNVKIMGSLDRLSNTIHVEKIEPSM